MNFDTPNHLTESPDDPLFEKAQQFIETVNPAISGNRGHDRLFAVACRLSLRHWLKFLKKQPWSRGSLDCSTYNIGLRGAGLGIPPATVIAVASRLIAKAGDTPNAQKITSQIERAYEFVGSGKRAKVGGARLAKRVTKTRRVSFLPSALARVAAKLEIKEDPETYIQARSPFCADYISSAEFLSSIFRPGESVILFEKFESQGQYIWAKDRHPHQPVPFGGTDGIWFLVNPVDGQHYPNPRQGNKSSRRSEESITSFRFAVLESDEADTTDWLKFLAQVPFRIVAIYYSGGRSVHALVQVDASDKADWDNKIKEAKHLLTLLGADPGALTAVRLSRLPQAWRGERQQKLIYLNPSADGTPICNLPKRPAYQSWLQFAAQRLETRQGFKSEDLQKCLKIIRPFQHLPDVAAVINVLDELQ